MVSNHKAWVFKAISVWNWIKFITLIIMIMTDVWLYSFITPFPSATVNRPWAEHSNRWSTLAFVLPILGIAILLSIRPPYLPSMRNSTIVSHTLSATQLYKPHRQSPFGSISDFITKPGFRTQQHPRLMFTLVHLSHFGLKYDSAHSAFRLQLYQPHRR